MCRWHDIQKSASHVWCWLNNTDESTILKNAPCGSESSTITLRYSPIRFEATVTSDQRPVGTDLEHRTRPNPLGKTEQHMRRLRSTVNLSTVPPVVGERLRRLTRSRPDRHRARNTKQDKGYYGTNQDRNQGNIGLRSVGGDALLHRSP